jgi:holo-[acyl-carrier protein] synthase
LIAGIGIDIVEVERLKGKTDLWKKFLSPKDFTYIKKFRDPTERVAGFWAAKEALVKALDDKTIEFTEINIAHNENGKPYFENVHIEGKLHLSISHERKFATAMVVWEKQG